ncbi:MAG: hypothetical protein IPH96_13470 [Saprospiraceae bacterium]|nr:hypothetical protein [Saprospiraceae bacterium]
MGIGRPLPAPTINELWKGRDYHRKESRDCRRKYQTVTLLAGKIKEDFEIYES